MRTDPSLAMTASSPPIAGASAETEAQTVAGVWRGMRLRYFAGVLSVVGGLILWEVISRVFIANPLFLAAPSQIVQAIVSLTLSGEMQRHMAISGIEFALGYLIASAIGIVLGFA